MFIVFIAETIIPSPHKPPCLEQWLSLKMDVGYNAVWGFLGYVVAA